MKPDAQGVLPYKNLFDVLGKTIRREGVTGLWIGFPVFYTRVAPHAIISLLVNETLRHLFVTERKEKPKH
jgi:solute carrier family 25 oxoglutarate transporter 11